MPQQQSQSARPPVRSFVRLSVGVSVQQQSVAMPRLPPFLHEIPNFISRLRGFGGSLKIAHPAVNRIYVRFLIWIERRPPIPGISPAKPGLFPLLIVRKKST